MHEHMQNLCDSLEYAYRDLAKVNRQIRDAGGELNPSNVEYIDKLNVELDEVLNDTSAQPTN